MSLAATGTLTKAFMEISCMACTSDEVSKLREIRTGMEKRAECWVIFRNIMGDVALHLCLLKKCERICKVC